ncbi:CHAD domain-containing protein [Nonomuraea roseoviolacea]|uniref:CHAD domain-containing protein n=1 Tax=Nonomuraea roseoviolacea subsp. carminata TaxID=160689 RepID=A0ABT1K2T9_9ACTN|nr:CYTH and CHAD domain-containing protein [Nonomuraea roseoviolacea]MCP2348318.1 CHAD domain-containing protein [Nonomuraea roseoviolacea subsp. carminata]
MGIEIEDKFDVPPDYTIPDLSRVGEVVGPKTHTLVALYYDTPDLRLAAHGVTLRRRRGGDDAGWHLKLPKAKGARQEIHHPLTRSVRVVPDELGELVRAYTRGAPLQAVAELETRRSVTVVRQGERRLVEVADDRVKGTVFGEASRIVRWREVEAELLDGDAQVLAKVGKRLRKAGATPAGASSKLLRLLDVPAPRRAATDPGSAGEVVVGYLASQVAALLAQDPRVRRAEEDAVHQMRVASRRLRSALKAFKKIVGSGDHLQDELKWLGLVLGEARDLEVIRERFAGELSGLAPELVTGPVLARLGDGLREREAQAYGRIRAALSGDRYYLLLDALDELTAAPELGKRAAGPAAEELPAVAAANWERVARRYGAAQEITEPEGHETAMHDVRKAAKRARYTAEALQDVLGPGAERLGKLAEGVQDALGEHQDAVVAQQTLAEEARAAREAGEDTLTYGVLIGLERARADRALEDFPEVWDRTTGEVGKALKKLAP